jgi:GTP-binding protein
MKINTSELNIIATRRSQYPTLELPEFLLVGRSNVGKSSFINTILNRNNLARVSATPGKTQTLNFYLVNNTFYLVDVPGYGYASLNREQQKKLGLMIEEYLAKRKELKRVFMIVDFRIKPTEDDVLMYQYLKYYDIPVTLILSKADKVGSSKREKNIKTILSTIDLSKEDNYIEFSNVTKKGRDTVLDLIEYLISDDMIVDEVIDDEEEEIIEEEETI